jgi:hypothetical protein
MPPDEHADSAIPGPGGPGAPGEPEPDRPIAEEPGFAPSRPRGELVRLSGLPQAELMVDVSVESNDTLSYFEVNSDKNGASLLICGSPCQFRIWPGRYRLLTNASSGYVGGSNLFVVERDSKVAIVEPRIYRPTLGAIIGSMGIASAIVGGILLASSTCEAGCSAETALRSQIGFVALGAGAVIAPIGWVLFAKNRNPEVTVSPRNSDAIE